MRNFGQTDLDDQIAGAARSTGVAGIGIMSALVGAAVGASVKPSLWWVGATLGFVVPTLILSPKKDELA
jgi:hypothetical protein